MKNLLIPIFLLSQINSQFLDSASPIRFENSGRLSKVNSLFILSGSSQSISNQAQIEGAVLRFEGDASTLVTIQYIFSNGVLSKKLKAKTFAEPGSDRFLASVTNEPKENIKGISYSAE